MEASWAQELAEVEERSLQLQDYEHTPTEQSRKPATYS